MARHSTGHDLGRSEQAPGNMTRMPVQSPIAVTGRVMNDQALELAKECVRQYRNCLFSAASLYTWLRFARYLKLVFVVAPLIFAVLASWYVYSSETHKFLAVIFVGIAGLIPAVYEALKMDDHIGDVKKMAGEYTNLRDRFRQAALVSALKPLPEFDGEFQSLMDRVEHARESGITAPSFCFRIASRQIDRGEYGRILEESQIGPDSFKQCIGESD